MDRGVFKVNEFSESREDVQSIWENSKARDKISKRTLIEVKCVYKCLACKWWVNKE